MNTRVLKTYAPAARRAFIAAVSAQAERYGVTATTIAPVKLRGDVLLTAGHAHPRAAAKPRKLLAERVQTQGYDQTMEAVAYTWFNRLVALRYMECHGYLSHGYRVLSGADPTRGDPARGDPVHNSAADPEILRYAADVDLPTLDRAKVLALKLEGPEDDTLYRMLLKAQCAALHEAMPFLFAALDGVDGLLLPANLLHSDSLIRQLVAAIPEASWGSVEIVGWLYQFYISENKDEVIGKAVMAADIPAATQLFTPNWIVKYMVQNSLGAQWLATYPQSPLREQMAHYVAPPEQSASVQTRLDALTPASLEPERLTLIDPACGAGHILVEAYDVFRAMYLERGYPQRDVATLILTHNLVGLDIDPRAVQLTGFALMMKARADDRCIFSRRLRLQVAALQGSTAVDVDAISRAGCLEDCALLPSDVSDLVALFEHAETFGSLIQVPAQLAAKLPVLRRLSEASSHDLFAADALRRLRPLVRQAELLARRYDAVVANPPYMGGRFMNAPVRAYIKKVFPGCERDLFAAFMARNLAFAKPGGRLGFMTPFVWMFISSYQALRARIIERETVISLVQLEFSAFPDAAVPICVFALQAGALPGYRGGYVRLAAFSGWDQQEIRTLEAINNRDCGWFFAAEQCSFAQIPSSPFVYWGSAAAQRNYGRFPVLGDICAPRQGLATGDNGRFVRAWQEIDWRQAGLGCDSRDAARASGKKWFPYNKGGKFRKWYGNNESVVDWSDDGADIHNFVAPNGRQRSRTQNTRYYFKAGIVYSLIGAANFGARHKGPGFVFDVSGASIFPEQDVEIVIAFLCSRVANHYLHMLSPTVNFQVGDLARLPLARIDTPAIKAELVRRAKTCVAAAKRDWDRYESSWDFVQAPVVAASAAADGQTLEASFATVQAEQDALTQTLRDNEAGINRIFIDVYGLQDELTAEVPLAQATLTGNPAYLYGAHLTIEEGWQRARQDGCEALISYAIGCMMGRYSLDQSGLVYAQSGGVAFEADAYATFPSDEDGIVPLTSTPWFTDDATSRLVAFIGTAWDTAHLEENLSFLAKNLGAKRGEDSRATLRRYLSHSFFKNHLKIYKKRPIYWLFSSGKQKTLQCLVYLHRYNEGTLARMRSAYVIPLQAKLTARLEQLHGDIAVATSTTHRKRLATEKIRLEKQQAELLGFDEKLRHFADKRIALDLDDGVKVNYGAFGDLLVDVKVVHGQKGQEQLD